MPRSTPTWRRGPRCDEALLQGAVGFTEEGKDASKLILPYPTANVTLQVFKHLPSQSRFTFYGLSAASGQSSVLYHSSGVNGAKFRHYVAEPNIPRQAALLEPDLIIISLGTNEAADYPYQDPRLEEQIGRLLNGLKNHCPGTPVVLKIGRAHV